jgi:alkylation response protein AidB-like acyl-CoA dehydrogenase
VRHGARLRGEGAPPARGQARSPGAPRSEVFERLGELGLWGLTIPEQFGGSGLGNLALALVLIELNRGCASTGVTLSVHNSLVGAPMKRFGSPSSRRTWFPRLATGEIIGAYCLTEPNAGSDAAALRTTAVEKDGEYQLDGTKLFVTNGAEAGLFIVYARTDPKVSKASGISAFLVPRDTKGVRVARRRRRPGSAARPRSRCCSKARACRPPNLLGEKNRGFQIAMDTLDGGRIGIAAQAVGIAQACLEASTKYAKERQQFGRRSANFQAIQWKLADMSTQHRGRAPAHAARRVAARPQRALRPAGRAGQALRLEDRQLLRRRGRADPRRRGLHRRVPRRAPLPRRAHHRDLRGRDGHPAHRDRAQGAGG